MVPEKCQSTVDTNDCRFASVSAVVLCHSSSWCAFFTQQLDDTAVLIVIAQTIKRTTRIQHLITANLIVSLPDCGAVTFMGVTERLARDAPNCMFMGCGGGCSIQPKPVLTGGVVQCPADARWSTITTTDYLSTRTIGWWWFDQLISVHLDIGDCDCIRSRLHCAQCRVVDCVCVLSTTDATTSSYCSHIIIINDTSNCCIQTHYYFTGIFRAFTMNYAHCLHDVVVWYHISYSN